MLYFRQYRRNGGDHVLSFENIKTILEESYYTAIDQQDTVIRAINILGQKRIFKLSELKENYYILTATDLEFMTFDNTVDIKVFELEFEEVETYTFKIRDFFYKLSEEEIQKIHETYGA